MSIYLLANVGTRDVQIDTPQDLPAELIANAKTGQLKARPAGAYLRQEAQFNRFQHQLRMPMIEKALRYIGVQAETPLRIVLFATDQPDQVRAEYRDNDTIEYANLMQKLLAARYQKSGLAKKQIFIRSTRHNPADYDLMLEFYRTQLPAIAGQAPTPGQVYLLIAGGTPQMNTMLLLIGSEVFGPDAQPLYVSQEFDRAYVLDISRQLYRKAVERDTIAILKAYAYSSALDLVEQGRNYFDTDQVSLLRSTLCYGIERRNLNLTAAAQAFDDTIASSRSLRGTIRSFLREVEDVSEVLLLRETIFLAQLAARTENWADFLSRLHRFSEGCLQLVAERDEIGVQWSKGSKRSTFDAAWWSQQHTLLTELGLDKAEPGAARRVDRESLRKIIGALATKPEQESIRASLVDLELVDRPIPLRNDIVHRFNPISRKDIEQKVEVTVDELLAAMRRAYELLFGVSVSVESPYDALNHLCVQLLKGEK
jgi:hypothetical protein